MHKVSPGAALVQCTDSILVCALQFDGRGDIYGGHEVALRVQKLMPHAKVVFSVLKPRFTTDDSDAFLTKEFVDISEVRKQEQWPIEEEATVLQSISTFKKIIVFPTYQDSYLPEEILNRNNDVIKLREYGVGVPKLGIVNGPTYTLGLDFAKNEKGVLLPIEWAGVIPPSNIESTEQRLLHLKDVEPALSKAILGKDFSSEAVKAFSQSSRLYLGYYSQPDVFFCFINALLATKKTNLVIYSTQKRPAELMAKVSGSLLENGFGMDILEFSDSLNFKQKRMNHTSKSKLCTFIFRPLSGTEMEAVLKASENETLSTGDLSPFKFMANRKTIIYDTRTQKHQSAEAMIRLATQYEPRFKELLSQAFFGDDHPSQTVNVSDLTNGMIQWIKAMEEDSSLRENWNKFIDEVFSKYDFTSRLAEILKERMSESLVDSE